MVSNNKTIQVNNNCKIYIMVPANVATGGPEALHQLAYVLKDSLKTNVFQFINIIRIIQSNFVKK